MQYGGLGQSPLFSGGGYLTPSIPNGSSTCFPYEAPQQGLAFRQTAPVAAQGLVGNVATWHSGMSPHKYEVVTLTPSAKCCYGCGNSFSDKYRSPPYNLVVQHRHCRSLHYAGSVSNINQVYGLSLHEFSVSQVDRAPARSMGGHRFKSCRGLRLFPCPTFMTC